MKNILSLLLISVLFYACKKDGDGQEQINRSDKIVLNEVIANNNTVKLSWSKLEVPDFKEYVVFRSDNSDGTFSSIKRISNKNETSFEDTSVPYAPHVEYMIMGSREPNSDIRSNIVSYLRPEVKYFSIDPFDAIYNKEDRLIYFFEKSGKIAIYDIDKKEVTKEINTNATLVYGDIGTFSGKKEIYVPRTDGWIFVYDALSLEKIDQINVGLTISSAVFSNNNLFVSTAARYLQKPLKVYSRATKLRIDENGLFELNRIKKVPNSNTELIEISTQSSPTDQNFYEFSSSGFFKVHKTDRYHGSHPLHPYIFEFFPDGSRYITSIEGSIYNKDMTYQFDLPRGNLEFTCFGFDDSRIFAGCQNNNIEIYSINDYTKVKSITTNGTPFRLFTENNIIISVNKTTESYPYTSEPVNRIVVEYLNK